MKAKSSKKYSEKEVELALRLYEDYTTEVYGCAVASPFATWLRAHLKKAKPSTPR